MGLSELGLSTALAQIRRYTDAKGLPAMITPKMLIVPPELEKIANKLLLSTLEPESGNNAVNFVNSSGMFPDGVQVNPNLIDTEAWFIKTHEDGLMFFDRMSPTFTEDNEFDSENKKFKSIMRFGIGVTDPRSIFGSPNVNAA